MVSARQSAVQMASPHAGPGAATQDVAWQQPLGTQSASVVHASVPITRPSGSWARSLPADSSVTVVDGAVSAAGAEAAQAENKREPITNSARVCMGET
jgi:hypothetical protein